MSTWFYQINQKGWSPQRYRFDIWEGERWRWYVGKKVVDDNVPEQGDIVVFFYAPAGGSDPGFYGWAVILDWYEETEELYFRPTAPSDLLKMHPWWDDEASALADEIRGKFKQGTFWFVRDEIASKLRKGIARWTAAYGRP